MKSLSNMPSLFDARPCIYSDRTGKLIILGGNMRYLAAKELEYKEVPVIVMSGLTIEQEREITIKDNSAFGEWDFEILENLWDDLSLQEWGVQLSSINVPNNFENLPDLEKEKITEYKTLILKFPYDGSPELHGQYIAFYGQLNIIIAKFPGAIIEKEIC